jgi:hypothetical protein
MNEEGKIKKVRAQPKLATFPQEFFDIYALAEEGKLELKFPRRGSAHNMLFRLHSFRRAVQREMPLEAVRLYQIDMEVVPCPEDNPEKDVEKPFILRKKVLSWKEQIAKMKEQMNTGEVELSGARALVSEAKTSQISPLLEVTLEAQKEEKGNLENTLKSFGFKGE